MRMPLPRMDLWQKQPRFLKQAFRSLPRGMTPEILAGIALEPTADARLIQRPTSDPTSQWRLRSSPGLTTRDFRILPTTNWTLLVREVETWIPAYWQWWHRFRFLPWWRFDDLMVSYATPGGGVGAHTDRYDVFLVQLQGKRQWQIETAPAREHPCRPGLPLRILKDFRPTAARDLDRGDALYLPPDYAHDGKAITSTLTLSIGFRAPLLREIWRALPAAKRGKKPPTNTLLTDPGIRLTARPGALGHTYIKHVKKLLRLTTASDAAVADALGRTVTRPRRYIERHPRVVSESWLEKRLGKDSLRLFRNPRVRACYHETSTPSKSTTVFSNGTAIPCPDRFTKRITDFLDIGRLEFKLEKADASEAAFLAALLQTGLLQIDRYFNKT